MQAKHPSGSSAAACVDLSNMTSTSQPPAPEPAATANTASQSRGPGVKQDYSCVLCKQRKVRCDRLNPCSSCVRAGVSCLPGVRQPYKRRRKHTQGTDQKRTQASERTHGLYSTPSRTLDRTSSPEESRPQRQVPTFGQYEHPLPARTDDCYVRRALLVTDFSLHRSLWTGLNDEVRFQHLAVPCPCDTRSLTRFLSPQFQDPRTTKSSSEDDTPSSVEYGSTMSPSALLFSAFRNAVDLRDFHPPPMQAFMLWQAFLQNVNPMSKVIHAPSVQPIIIEASKDLETVPKPSVALLFAIYAAAIMSLKEEDCQAQFDAPKPLLLTRYFSACQQALAAASFMKSRNLVTLQAFVIFLVGWPFLNNACHCSPSYSFLPAKFTMSRHSGF